MIDHGLSEKQLKTIKTILQPWIEQIESVALFGSRATGKYRDNSDIDMVIYGAIDNKIIARLSTLFNESNLPYKVDITGYNLVDYPPFKEHIDEVNKTLFTRETLKVR